MGCSKSSSKWEVYLYNTSLPRETRKTLNRQLNFTLKTGKEKEEQQKPKLAEGKKS